MDLASIVPMLMRTIREQSAQISSLTALTEHVQANAQALKQLEAKQEETFSLLRSMAAFQTSSAAASKAARADIAIPAAEKIFEEAGAEATNERTANDPDTDGVAVLPADLPAGMDTHYFLR